MTTGGTEDLDFALQPIFGALHFQERLLLFGNAVEVAGDPVGQFERQIGDVVGHVDRLIHQFG